MERAIVYDVENNPLCYNDPAQGVYILRSGTSGKSLMAVGGVAVGEDDRMKLLVNSSPRDECKYISKQCVWSEDKEKAKTEVLVGDVVQFISTGTNCPGCNIWSMSPGTNSISLATGSASGSKMLIQTARAVDKQYILKLQKTDSYLGCDSSNFLCATKCPEGALVVQFARHIEGKDETKALNIERVLDCDRRGIDYEKDLVDIIETRTADAGNRPTKAVGIIKVDDSDYRMQLVSYDGEDAKYISKHMLWRPAPLSPLQCGFFRFISAQSPRLGYDLWTWYWFGIGLGREICDDDNRIAILQNPNFKKNEYILAFHVRSDPVIQCFYVRSKSNGTLSLTTYMDDALVVQFAKDRQPRTCWKYPFSLVVPDVKKEENRNSAEFVCDSKGSPLRYTDHFFIVSEMPQRLAVGLGNNGENGNWIKLISLDAEGNEGKCIAKQYMTPVDSLKKGEKVKEGEDVLFVSRGINRAGRNIWTGDYVGVKLCAASHENKPIMKVVKRRDTEYVLQIKTYCTQPNRPPHVTDWCYVAAQNDVTIYLTTFLDYGLVVKFMKELDQIE